MYLIYRHLLRSAAGPFFFGLFVITFLLMINVLYTYVDLFVTKGVPFGQATKFLVLSLGHTFALSVPMSVLIAVLMGVGQLAADNEITALKASGVSLWTVLRPLLMGGLVVFMAQTAYNHFVFPRANHALANLSYDISRSKPMLEIQERRFTQMSDKMTIYVKKKDDLTGRIEGVSIFEKPDPGNLSPRLTLATWGTIIPDHATDSMLIELHDGEIHDLPDKEKPETYRVNRFKQYNLTLDNVERDFKESGRKSKSDREMDLRELWDAAARENEKQVEVHDQVRGLGDNLVTWQFGLLSSKKREMILGVRSAPEDPEERLGWLKPKFRATRLKVKRAEDQAGYQQKIGDTYRIKESRYLVEFHKKFAIPFACVVFTLVGVPMAVTTSRSGKGVSVSLAIAVFLVYYLFLMGGEKFADRGKLDPFLAMWSANIILLAVGIPIFFKTVREGSLLSITLRPPQPQEDESTA
jgi:lipopolysaccharide export system permease protein